MNTENADINEGLVRLDIIFAKIVEKPLEGQKLLLKSGSLYEYSYSNLIA